MGVTSIVLQNEQRTVFVTPKVCSFFYWGKLRTNTKVVSIVAKRGNW